MNIVDVEIWTCIEESLSSSFLSAVSKVAVWRSFGDRDRLRGLAYWDVEYARAAALCDFDGGPTCVPPFAGAPGCAK